jgi:hypothetical protein
MTVLNFTMAPNEQRTLVVRLMRPAELSFDARPGCTVSAESK